LSERTACKLLGVDRSSYRYEPKPDRNTELREELVKLARQKPRYGYRRLHVLLERRGYVANVKRVYRLYLEERLSVRRRKRKRLVRDRALVPHLIRPNQEWAMDFIVDGLATGRMVRILSVVDAYNCLEWRAIFAQFYDRGRRNGAVRETQWSVLRKSFLGSLCALPLAFLVPLAWLPAMLAIPALALFVYFNHRRHHPSHERYLAQENTHFAVIPDAPQLREIPAPQQRLLTKGDNPNDRES